MNVNINVNVNTNYKKASIPKLSNKKEEFEKVLDNHELNSKDFLIANAHKNHTESQNLDQTDTKNLDKKINEDQSKDVKKTTEKPLKELKNNNKSTEGIPQIGQLSQSLNSIVQSVENDESTGKTAQVQQLITQVDEVNGDFSLLKIFNEKNTVEGKTEVTEKGTMDLGNSDDNNKLESKVINFVELAIDALKQNTEKASEQLVGTDKSTEKVTQIQQVLQSVSLVLQSVDKTMTINSNKLNSINLEQMLGVDKLLPETKNLLKDNLSEIVDLIEKSKVNNDTFPKILDVLQKLTTEVKEANGNLSLLKITDFQNVSGNSEDKSIKDNILKMLAKQSTTTSENSTNNQMQSSTDAKGGNKSSGDSSSEGKFLDKLLSGNKDDTKISKAVNFMNQFETLKTSDTAKVETTNLVINKNNFELDVIKSVKFMEINNIKDLVVKMNPKELGEITIKLTLESGIIKANISAQNKDTYNLLNTNIQDISDRLKNMDIKIHSLDINIYEDSTFFSKDSNGKNNNDGQNSNAKTRINSEEDIPIIDNYVIEENQVNKFV